MRIARHQRLHARVAQRNGPNRAFTVIELMIVIAIIGIVAAFAYPKVNFTQFRVDAAARTVRVALQNAERLAVTRQYDVVVSFDLVNSRIRILEDNNNNAIVDAGEHVIYAPLEDSVHFAVPPAGVSGSPGAPIIGGSIKTVDGMPTLIFHRDGAASSDADIYITSKRAKNDDFRCVRVIQSTGRTLWWRYLTGTWEQASI
ncbi:MAG: prepilin-type N-terminal cleavage/methylation domain-containing protein [Gemmatimonadaceae bacterium]